MEEPAWPVCGKEMGSTKNDETIPGSEEMEWGPLPHMRKERMLSYISHEQALDSHGILEHSISHDFFSFLSRS